MSLEQTLERTNELLAQVITILQTGAAAQDDLGPAETKAPRTRRTKTEMAADAAAAVGVTTAPNNVLGTVDGDPEGTRYFLIEKHNTVYAQKPGDPVPTIQGAVLIPAAEYVAKKAQFAAMTQAATSSTQAATSSTPAATSSTPAAPATAPAAAPAPSTPSAPTVSSDTSENEPSAEVPFAKVVEAMTAISKSDKPGHGRDGVLAVLKKYLPGDERPTVTKLQPLGLNAQIVKHVEAMLAPAAEAEFDPLA